MPVKPAAHVTRPIHRRKRRAKTASSTFTPSPHPATSAVLVKPPPVVVAPLIKTIYNKRRFWQFASALGVALLAAGIYFGYAYRSAWLPLVRSTPSSSPIYKLQVNHETIDSAKAQQILQQQHIQATTSASPSELPSASGSAVVAPPASVVATYSIDQLKELLHQQILQLQRENQDVRTLQSYLTRANSQPDRADSILREGVQLARELQALYLYYQK